MFVNFSALIFLLGTLGFRFMLPFIVRVAWAFSFWCGLMASANAAGQGVGMPHLDFSTYPSQIFWVFISLLILFFFLTRYVIPRISGVMQDRQSRVSSDLSEADRLRLEAENARGRYMDLVDDFNKKIKNVYNDYDADLEAYKNEISAAASVKVASFIDANKEKMKEMRRNFDDMIGSVSEEIVLEVMNKAFPEINNVSQEHVRGAVDKVLGASSGSLSDR